MQMMLPLNVSICSVTFSETDLVWMNLDTQDVYHFLTWEGTEGYKNLEKNRRGHTCGEEPLDLPLIPLDMNINNFQCELYENKRLGMHMFRVYQGFPTRMVYLYYISCLRYTILVGNPRYSPNTHLVCSMRIMIHFRNVNISENINKSKELWMV